MIEAALGRRLAGPTLGKHHIKHAGRFCANHRITVADGMRGGITQLCRRRREPLLIARDGVAIRSFQTLKAAALVGGRALPLLGASYPAWELYKSPNNREEGLLRLLRDLVPAPVAIIMLADRGFGRAELARTCLGLPGVHLVFRIKPAVGVPPSVIAACSATTLCGQVFGECCGFSPERSDRK